MRRKRHTLRRRFGGGSRRTMWRVWSRGADVGMIAARDHGEALRKARRIWGEGVRVEASGA